MADKGFAYDGIKRELKARIESGELPEGSRIPSEYELARRLEVSRNQTRHALRELELEGYLIRRRGSGSYVAPAENRVVTNVFGKDTTVAIVFPRYVSGYCREVVDGFMHRIAMAGLQTIAYNVQFDEESEARSLRAIAQSGIAGLVLWVEHNDEPCRQLVRELRAKAFPVVLADRYVSDVDVDWVTSDNVEVGYRLTKALIDRGHRRIAFIGSRRGNPTSVAERRNGYLRALEEAEIPVDERLTTHIRERVYEEPSVVAGELMGLYDRPSAIVCLHDFVACLLHDELVNMGYSIPEHVELAAVEERHPQRTHPVPMLKISQRGFDIGTTSADLLLARLAEPNRPAQKCLIEPTELTVDYEAEAASRVGKEAKNKATLAF